MEGLLSTGPTSSSFDGDILMIRSLAEHYWRKSNINTGDWGQGRLLGDKEQLGPDESSRRFQGQNCKVFSVLTRTLLWSKVLYPRNKFKYTSEIFLAYILC